MVDTRTWDSRTFASYMRARRGEGPLRSDELGLLVAKYMISNGGSVTVGLHIALASLGVAAADHLGFDSMTNGDYWCRQEFKFMMDGRQVVIPAGTDIGRS